MIQAIVFVLKMLDEFFFITSVIDTFGIRGLISDQMANTLNAGIANYTGQNRTELNYFQCSQATRRGHMRNYIYINISFSGGMTQTISSF